MVDTQFIISIIVVVLLLIIISCCCCDEIIDEPPEKFSTYGSLVTGGNERFSTYGSLVTGGNERFSTYGSLVTGGHEGFTGIKSGGDLVSKVRNGASKAMHVTANTIGPNKKSKFTNRGNGSNTIWSRYM
jgi:hypothetical protein